ncbi:PREDICTED: uncharacterized protein LOC109129123 [Camelina sativa]|uniref:Uncharacterized protein LOC109129123 n=1 Tax=Camelina sativa TaxID=90675 RepID=A0ABM1QZW9_CAMSA|nr:PREDICTED: uncharacterized protein LOC109129123 [Camelina sativa]
MARVMHGRYFRNKHPLSAQKPYNPSFAWRSIYSTKALVEQGARWAVGSGCSISVWRDPWLPDTRPRPANGRGRLLLPSLMGNHLINPSTKDWHLPILEEFFDPEDIPVIRSIAVSKVFKPDSLVWHFTKSGKYSVKSGYRLARELITEVEIGPTCTALRAHAWKLEVPSKVQHFFWQVASGTLPVLERLAHRGIRCDMQCKRCGLKSETINHALFECPRSMSIWELSPLSLEAEGQSGITNISIYLPWILWSIWKDRNKKGLGWFCDGDDSTILLGARSQRRGLTPLHAELQALLWAMESILEARVDCQAFETDCAELIAMVQKPDDWPAFTILLEDFSILRSSFPFFTLDRIPRESNVRADCLARSSKTLVFEISFVNSFPLVWATNLGVLF